MANYQFNLQSYEEYFKEQLATHLEKCAELTMRSNVRDYNDTAVMCKTFLLAAEIVRGKPIEFI